MQVSLSARAFCRRQVRDAYPKLALTLPPLTLVLLPTLPLLLGLPRLSPAIKSSPTQLKFFNYHLFVSSSHNRRRSPQVDTRRDPPSRCPSVRSLPRLLLWVGLSPVQLAFFNHHLYAIHFSQRKSSTLFHISRFRLSLLQRLSIGFSDSRLSTTVFLTSRKGTHLLTCVVLS